MMAFLDAEENLFQFEVFNNNNILNLVPQKYHQVMKNETTLSMTNY